MSVLLILFGVLAVFIGIGIWLGIYYIIEAIRVLLRERKK